jgi:catechol 2,3-dioxygenase-like lactoylglutathione lyase family enzyme
MTIDALHHVSIVVTDLDRSRAFYRDTLGLQEIGRPPFPFPGAWFALGPAQQLHLLVHSPATLRGDSPIDSRDNHFALRVPSYRAAVDHLRSRGFSEHAPESDPMRMVLSPHATAGFPQIYILDPDHHVIEINAAALDRE